MGASERSSSLGVVKLVMLPTGVALSPSSMCTTGVALSALSVSHGVALPFPTGVAVRFPRG